MFLTYLETLLALKHPRQTWTRDSRQASADEGRLHAIPKSAVCRCRQLPRQVQRFSSFFARPVRVADFIGTVATTLPYPYRGKKVNCFVRANGNANRPEQRYPMTLTRRLNADPTHKRQVIASQPEKLPALRLPPDDIKLLPPHWSSWGAKDGSIGPPIEKAPAMLGPFQLS